MLRLSTGLAAVLAFGAVLTCASASTVSITPVRLTLVRSGSAVDLTVSNGNPQPTRFSVRAYRWRQSPTGEIELSPSDDVIVYPQTFTVPPLDRRVVRVGFTRPILPQEQTYRILINELPAFDETHQGQGIQVLANFSVPLFIAPPDGESHPGIKDASIRGNKLTFALEAVGTVHVLPTSLQIRGLDGAGKVVFESSAPSWYVLADQPRLYALSVPAGACARTQQLRFDLTFERAPPLSLTAAPAREC